jgi:predicted nucleotidyltransferase
MIDIKSEHFEIVLNILKKYLKDCQIIIFGSRVTGNSNKFSDLDIVIDCNEKIKMSVLFNLEEEFQESDLPFRVDIIDWNRTSESFKKVINKKCIKIKL